MMWASICYILFGLEILLAIFINNYCDKKNLCNFKFGFILILVNLFK